MNDELKIPIISGALTATEIRQLVGKDDPVIIEVGANCGQTTAELLKAMPRATIFAFEPEPRAIAKFRNTIANPNVHLYECAIGAMNGTTSFYQSSGAEHLLDYREGWDQSGSIRRPNSHLKVWPWVKFEKQITVPIITLDDWSKQHRITKADFIWADVQGAESDLVEGAALFLRSSRYFYTEYSNDEWYEGQITLNDLLEKLPDFDLVRRYAMDALFKNKRILPETGGTIFPRNLAVPLIDEGNALEEKGLIREAMARYDAAVEADPQCARAHLNRGNILLAGTRFDEARGAYQLAITCDSQYAAAHFNLGNLNYRLGDLELALRNYQVAIGIRPDFVDALVAMANALDGLGRTAEAVESYERALVINPGYAEIHFNLGVLATTQGRHEEAANSLRRAVEIKPDFAQAHHNLGVVLTHLDQLDAAEASLRRASSIEPESAEFACDLAMNLLLRHKSPEAVELLLRMLGRAPAWNTKVAFARCVARTRFMIDGPEIRAALTIAIAEPWWMPHELCRPALSLIMLDQRIARCVRVANGSWPARLPKMALFGSDGLAALAADPLVHALLVAAPVTTIEFERFLTCARHTLLETASSEPTSDSSEIAALEFYAALSRQCFITEYIFDCDDRERTAATACRAKLLSLLDLNAVIPPILVLAVAAYFPLYTLPEPRRLLAAIGSGPVEEVLCQQIHEPLAEQALRVDIQCLTTITGGVSEEVRDQYEQNPYPRWVKLPVRDDQAPHLNDELRRMLPFGPLTPMPDDCAPEALVAGCGTGSHSIIAAQRFRGVRVLAIDLSLSSISYAKRKTQELGLTNIEYAQADILKLGDVTRTFDIIESVGVLHHLADPFAGWRILLSRLRPGGFMSLGFYSEIARRNVVKAREIIAAHGYSSTPDDIRRFRQDLATQNPSVELQWLSEMPDFYSTSECRDLLFHVQEHRLTLDQIESFLAEFRLHFIGFDLDPRVLRQYRMRFVDDQFGTNLRNWALFEADNPDTFAGMYRFWIQQPICH
jgi:FkbM family methyltransferase